MKILKEQETKWDTHDIGFLYSMLDRMYEDCKYYLGWGHRNEDVLWAKDVNDQLRNMQHIYDLLPEEPEWLTKEEFEELKKQMLEK